MKKIFLFLTAATLMFSCSDDDNKSDNKSNAPVQVTIDGKRKAFDKVQISRESHRIYITALNQDNSEIFMFEVDHGYTGDDEMIYPKYIIDDIQYDDYDDTAVFTDNVEFNNDYRLKGTFQGRLIAYDSDNNKIGSIELKDGSVDIAYEQK